MDMIKIINPKLLNNQIKYRYCNTILEYGKKDIIYNKEKLYDYEALKYAYIKHIICPVCKNTLYIQEEENNDSGNFISWRFLLLRWFC